MTVTRINEFQAAENKSVELFEFLKSIVPYIASSAGNISVEVLKNTETQDKFLVIEKWESMQAHRTSVAAFSKEKMQSAMSLIGAPPKGSYYGA